MLSNMLDEKVMTDQFFDPTQDGNGPTMYVGVNLPRRLFDLLEQEAQQTMVSRSDVLRWALADRYKKPGDNQEPAT
jgi:hypothetical protein